MQSEKMHYHFYGPSYNVIYAEKYVFDILIVNHLLAQSSWETWRNQSQSVILNTNRKT